MTEMKSPSDAELVEQLAHLPVERDTVEHYRGYLRRQLVMNRSSPCRKEVTAVPILQTAMAGRQS